MRLFSIFEVWTCKNVMCPVCSAPWICERLTERFSTDGVLIRFVGVLGGAGGGADHGRGAAAAADFIGAYGSVARGSCRGKRAGG